MAVTIVSPGPWAIQSAVIPPQASRANGCVTLMQGFIIHQSIDHSLSTPLPSQPATPLPRFLRGSFGSHVARPLDAAYQGLQGSTLPIYPL